MNFSNHYTSQEPNREKTMKEVSVLGVGGKLKRNIPRKNSRNQVRTENPIHVVPPIAFELGFPSMEGKARYHYANLTVQSYCKTTYLTESTDYSRVSTTMASPGVVSF